MLRILQISSGRGPAECTWVVAQVLKVMLTRAKSAGLKTTTLHRETGIENRTLFSATLQVEGEKAQEFALEWVGTIQWIGQSPFRKFHKRKNWFIGVSELQLAKEETNINDKDISYQATRAGGPGGQHVNKVSTAIRATHIPTGMCVLASDSRSQLQNKKLARERLFKMLEIKQLQARNQKVKEGWQCHNELERGNPIMVFKGTEFKPLIVNKMRSKKTEGISEKAKTN